MLKSEMNSSLFFICWIIVLIVPFYNSALLAQISLPPAGSPFIRNYPPAEYGAPNQNWAILQDERGVMYFGNNEGILEYDGVSWQLIQTKEKSTIRSLAMAQDGRIYAGSVSEIGYVTPDIAQRLQFVSLLPHLDEKYRDFADVWQTFATSDGIFFVTSKYIFRWDGRQMRVWEARTSFHVGFEVNGRFYVRQREIGLMQITSDSLTMAPLGEKFADERIFAMLPFASGGKNRILLATRNNGLLLYDGLSIEHFTTGADALLAEGQVYCGTRLAGGQYAFGTLQNGVLVVDAAGRLLHHLNKATGLQDDTVWYLYPDRQGGLWIGMHVGISRAETGSPLTYFGEREGVEGSVLDIIRHEGRLYAATTMGIYYLDESPGSPRAPGKFRRVSGVSPQCWAFLPFGQVLLAGAFDGVYELQGSQGRLINSTYAMSLHRSRQDANRIFVGLQDGVKSLYFDGRQWVDEGRIEGVDYEIRSMYEMPDHKLWLTSYNKGLLLADFSNGFTRQPALERFDTLQGLPSNDRTIAFSSSKGLRFATQRGVFRFDENQRHFFPDSSLVSGLPNAKTELFSISEDGRGNLWMVTAGEVGLALRQANGYYVWQEDLFWHIIDLNPYYAYPDPLQEVVTWLGCIDRVVRNDGAAPRDKALDFPTLIRQVIANGDSLLYGGAMSRPEGISRLGYAFNSLRFSFAAPSFDDESKTEYQYLLEGYDDGWSDWSVETYKDYTRLQPGAYRFLARARDIHQRTGTTAVYEFRILPPFYLTWWAYCLYALLLAGGLFALRKFEVERMQKKHLRAMKQLEYEKLIELDQLKSRFFADISHEFRTPLTLILGPVDKLLAAQPATEQARQFQLIKRNAQRLLRLINQLLDLSKLEAGKMKLDLRLEDAIPLFRTIACSFESLVESKKVRLRFESGLESAFLYFDRDKMEKILTNVVSNAVKFTPEGGEVQVEVKVTEAGDWLQIEVSDTGPGIPEAQLPHVFDRFFQGGEASRAEEPGSGIGLALTKELVELHQGRISVSSSEGHGARFRILFPYGKEEPVPPVAEPEELAGENTLLLVEDNPDMRAFIRESVSGSYRVIEAADGQEGVEKALEHIPDIIISDVMMPRKDGLQLCETLKNDERTSHIPIILLTAKASIESRLAGLERGADDYLSKPFHREELLIRSRNLLEWRQRLRARYASLQPPAPAEDKNVQIEDAFLQKIRDIILRRLSDVTLEIDQLSRLAGMSRSQLFRKIKALTGMSPSLFIRAIRLQRAKELLQTTEMNVSEVAYEVGFSSPNYFSDAFTETFGTRPSQLRK